MIHEFVTRCKHFVVGGMVRRYDWKVHSVVDCVIGLEVVMGVVVVVGVVDHVVFRLVVLIVYVHVLQG